MAREPRAAAERLARRAAGPAESLAERRDAGPELAKKPAHWRQASGVPAAVPDGQLQRPAQRDFPMQAERRERTELAVNGIPVLRLAMAESQSRLSVRTLRVDGAAPASPPCAAAVAGVPE